jgi:MoxR-like ATPase
MRLELGVPSRSAERTMLLGLERRDLVRDLKPVLEGEALREIQTAVRGVHTSAALLDYLQDVLEGSRRRHRTGLSPRAGLALLRASQAWAFMQRRDMVLPEDLQAVGVAVMAHRLGEDFETTAEGGRALAQSLLRETAVA